MTETSTNLIAYCRDNNRVCPMPPSWNALWEMLPERKRAGVGWEPPAPLILAAWHDTPAMFKAARLAEHIEWAASHGALEPIAAYLKGLPESDWFHVGEST